MAIMLRAYSGVDRNINVVNKNRIFGRDRACSASSSLFGEGAFVCAPGPDTVATVISVASTQRTESVKASSPVTRPLRGETYHIAPENRKANGSPMR
jgi:hypothetical protein